MRVDAERRSRVAQLHTDSHILNALVYERFPGTLVTGAQINADGTGRMDFDLSEVDNDVLRGLDAEINDVIGRGVDVRSVYVDAAEADAVAGLVRSLSVAPPPTPDGTLRVIEIDGVDRQACGGHPPVEHRRSRARSASRRSRTRASATAASASSSTEPQAWLAAVLASPTELAASAASTSVCLHRVPLSGCRPAAAGRGDELADHPGRLVDRGLHALGVARAAQTTTMPMPMFSVRCSSWASRPVASSATSWNSGGTGHEPRSIVGVDVGGQHPRDVLRQAAAGDVGQRLDARRSPGRRSSTAR